MPIAIQGTDDPALRAHVTERLTRLLDRLPARAVRADVVFTDENGPKGGLDTRCAVTVRLPRRAPIHVEAVAERPRRAADLTGDRLERTLQSELERRRDAGRRPRKYYAARRAAE